MLSCYVALRSEFHIVVSITFSELKQGSIRLHLQLFVGVIVSYLRYLYLLTHNIVQHLFSCVFYFFCLRLVYTMLPVSLDF